VGHRYRRFEWDDLHFFWVYAATRPFQLPANIWASITQRCRAASRALSTR